ncbi:hypothetical protein SAMN06313486_10630 [Epsilonproteobacteria bacterium SCGC AD-308-P11]|jgi:uncharacterized SAM-binding protein YcdF (DUF218 family)|nr:hypothetical protein SAMN06313486_10630 [Epsilonproteobacteria bacterium SCGC AD-308-P11]
MMEVIKRYSMALVFLFLVIFLMLIATLGVKSFGDKMLENTDLKITPTGERIN